MSSFSALRRTFSGHFHLHQTLGRNFVYVGSPLQFNFGDAGLDAFKFDVLIRAGDSRGVVVYDYGSNKFNHVINPHCYQFHKISESDLPKVEANPEK